jgi:hypothetical protein
MTTKDTNQNGKVAVDLFGPVTRRLSPHGGGDGRHPLNKAG